MSDAETNVLKTIIDALKPLTSEERQRTLEVALVFLGEESNAGLTDHNLNTAEDDTAGVANRSETVREPRQSQIEQK